MRTVLIRSMVTMAVVGMASVASAQEAPRTARPLSPKALERVVHQNQKNPFGARLTRALIDGMR